MIIKMKVLAVGDIVGESGLNKLKELLPTIIEKENIDFTIVNAENTSGGMGLTDKDFNALQKMKIDVITMGNHTWGKKDIFAFIDNPKILRPANYSKGVPGKGYNIYECKGKKIAVMNLIGRTDMNILSENPFTVADELVDKLRNQVDCPIVFLTAKSEENSLVNGLSLGADDYICKPFGVMELRARISAHLRREQREHSVRISFEHSSFNISAKQFSVKDVVVPLTKGEYEICEFLARNQGQVFTKEQILENVFGYDSESNDSTIITHIKNIRNKLQEFEYAPIKTVWGVGYKWEE